MQIDPEELRRHYASLADEALRAIDRTELVDVARTCYDEELARREPVAFAAPSVRGAPLDRTNDEEAEVELDDYELDDDTDVKPAWLEEAVCACSFAASPGDKSTGGLADATNVLRNAGIPAHTVLEKIDPPRAAEQYEYRVMVPSGLNLQAASVLEKEIFNSEIEDTWRAHFAGLSNEELFTLKKEALFGGLLDRLERVTRAYEEELARRKFRP